MPKKWERCVKHVKAKIRAGKLPKGSNAYAICSKLRGKHRKKKKK